MDRFLNKKTSITVTVSLICSTKFNTVEQGWPTSTLPRAKTKKFQILRAIHKFMVLKLGETLY
jgi:hypothetical protein